MPPDAGDALSQEARFVHIRGMEWTETKAPDAGAVEALAMMAIAALPEEFRTAASQVVLRVEDFASDEMLAEVGLEDAFELTGLYDGVPLTEKCVTEQVVQPDAIWLFRRPILDEWLARGDISLGELVTHVYVHELAHHFGWSDADIATIDRWWE